MTALVKMGKHAFRVEDIIAWKIDENLEGYIREDKIITRVWLRTHHGQWSFFEPGNHDELLTKACEEHAHPLRDVEPLTPPPTEEDRAAFVYVLENSDPVADADDPFVRVAKWALARSA